MYTVSGIDLRISQGAKAPDDLRCDARIGGRWIPLKMELVFFLVDFFSENEQALAAHRSWWRQNGDRYFLSKCIDAVRRGWRAVAAEIEEQRARRAER